VTGWLRAWRMRRDLWRNGCRHGLCICKEGLDVLEPRCVCGHVHGCIFGKVAGKQGTANLQDEALVCVSPKSTAVDLVQVDFHSCKIKRRGRFLFSFYAVCIGIRYHFDKVSISCGPSCAAGLCLELHYPGHSCLHLSPGDRSCCDELAAPSLVEYAHPQMPFHRSSR
jgi:hypothetical protein